MPIKPSKPELMEALYYIQEEGKASIALLTRTMMISDTRSKAIIDKLEQMGYISEQKGTKARTILKHEPAARKRRARKKKEKALSGRDAEGKGGQPDLYVAKDIHGRLKSIEGWMRQGMTMEELAEWLEVGLSTLYRWQQEKKAFRDAIRAGRQEADGEIIHSAGKMAQDRYVTKQVPMKVKDYKEVEELVYDSKGQPVRDPVTKEQLSITKWIQYERVDVIEVREFIPGNAQMNQFLLQNRRPDLYKKKDREADELAAMSEKNPFSHMTDAEILFEKSKIIGGDES